jgi:hypothetical protein
VTRYRRFADETHHHTRASTYVAAPHRRQVLAAKATLAAVIAFAFCIAVFAFVIPVTLISALSYICAVSANGSILGAMQSLTAQPIGLAIDKRFLICTYSFVHFHGAMTLIPKNSLRRHAALSITRLASWQRGVMGPGPSQRFWPDLTLCERCAHTFPRQEPYLRSSRPCSALGGTRTPNRLIRSKFAVSAVRTSEDARRWRTKRAESDA